MNLLRMIVKTVIGSSLMLTLLAVVAVKAINAEFLTDSNDLECIDIQCPDKCPADSYLKSSSDTEEDDIDDYETDWATHEPYAEDMDVFVQPPLVKDSEAHKHHMQKRELPTQQEIEKCCPNQHCVCQRCDTFPSCADGHVAIQIHAGTGMPGDCCPAFRCEPKLKCALGVKQSYWKENCIKCSCFGDNELCENHCPPEEVEQHCFSSYWNSPMLNGDVWMEGPYTSCSCEQGNSRCITAKHAEEPITEVEVPPAVENATQKSVIEELGHTEIPKVVVELNSTTATSILMESSGSTTELSPGIIANEENSTMMATSTASSGDSSSSISPSSMETSTSASFSFQGESDASSTMDSSTATVNIEISSSTAQTVVENATVSAINIDDATTSSSSAMHTNETTYDALSSSSTTTTAASVQPTSSISGSTMDAITSDTLASTTSSTTSNISADVSSTVTQEASRDIIVSTSARPIETMETSTLNTDLASKQLENVTQLMENSTTASLDSATEMTNITSATPINATEESTQAIASSTFTSILNPSANAKISTIVPKTTDPTTNTLPESTSPSALPKQQDALVQTPTIASGAASTTSAPFSRKSSIPADEELTATTLAAISTLASTTTSPELLESLHQQKQLPIAQEDGYGLGSHDDYDLRTPFDEITYIVIIVLAIGALLCIALGLIIRYTKNRKKMYCSIPNSETSLSQTSTHTTMTV